MQLQKTIKFITIFAIIFCLFYILIGKDFLMQRVIDSYEGLFEKVERFDPSPYKDIFISYNKEDYDAAEIKILEETDRYIRRELGILPEIFLGALIIALAGILHSGREIFSNNYFVRIILIVYILFSLSGFVENYGMFRIVLTLLVGVLFYNRYTTITNDLKDFYSIIYLALIILYNPFFPIYLQRDLWIFINILTIAVTFFEKLSQDKSKQQLIV